MNRLNKNESDFFNFVGFFIFDGSVLPDAGHRVHWYMYNIIHPLGYCVTGYCKFGNFRENFNFASSVKGIFAT